jgi:hypothetical protein
MSPTTDAKRHLDACVLVKAHFTMSESDARQTFGSVWNTHLVSGTVESAHVDESGKGVRVSVAGMWDLPAGCKLVKSMCGASRPGMPPVLHEWSRCSN